MGKCLCTPFTGKAVIEAILKTYELFVDTHVTFIISRKVVGLISDGVLGFFVDLMLPAALWPRGGPDRNERKEYLLRLQAADS